ncbi:MAG: hypothetical protein AB8H03_26295 [Saprospiraceae bacterium]
MKKILCLLFTIAISFSTFAIEGILVKTTDYSFQNKWFKTISSSAPRLLQCDTVYKNQTVSLTAIAGGFAFDKNDLADVDYSIKVFTPDGSVYFSQKKLEVIKGKVENKNSFQMSRNILQANFAGNDSFGTYKIEIQITDNISQEVKKLATEIILAELPLYNKSKIDQEKFNSWLDRYFEHPLPVTAVNNYIFYSKSPLAEDDSKFLPIFSVFLEIFKNNKYLYPQVLDAFKNEDEKTRTYLVYLIHYSQMGSTEFFSQLEGTEKLIYSEIKDSKLPDLYGEITDPSQLDMLWSTFTAGGGYEPILKLIQTLEYTKFQGKLEQYKTSKQTEEDRTLAINDAIYGSLTWSFSSNCQQYDLVKSYAKWALQFENLTEVQKNELKILLDKL